MIAQPLRIKAFQLAERLGMTAYELMDRMTMPEILEWFEYDRQHFDDSWYQHAQLMSTIARITGNKRARPKDFLPGVKKVRKRRRSIEEVRRDLCLSLGIAG